MIVDGYKRLLDDLVTLVEERATVEEAIQCLAFHDQIRKRLDRIQADPKRRPTMSQTDSPPRPEREGREGDTQPMPKEVEGAVMHQVVIDALRDRLAVGIHRYGQPLRAFNGRDAAQDAFEEVLDLSVYLAQVRVEMAELRAIVGQMLQFHSLGFGPDTELIERARRALG